jgi:hypothetical protein
MANWQRRLLGLGLPCLFALCLDTGLTLHGQPAEYWAGDYSQTTEGAPFYRRLYAWHPAAAGCGHLIWAGVLGGLLILLPEVLAVVLAIAVVFGHTAGAYTWIQGMLLHAHGPAATGWYQAANGMFLLAAVAVGVGIHWTVRSTALRTRSVSEQRLPGWVRWILVAALAVGAAAIVFVPW